MRHIFKIDNNKRVNYGYDSQIKSYFVEIIDESIKEEFDIDSGVIAEYSDSPLLLLTTKGKLVDRQFMINKLKELGCSNEEHLNCIKEQKQF